MRPVHQEQAQSREVVPNVPRLLLQAAPAGTLRVPRAEEAQAGGGRGPATGQDLPTPRQAAGDLLPLRPEVCLHPVRNGGTQGPRHGLSCSRDHEEAGRDH